MRDETNTRLNQKQYDLLRNCSEKKDMRQWNEWRREHPETSIKLVGADLEQATLNQADLERADLRAANLQSAVLNGANFRDANLNGTLFFQADLRDADFQGAFLYGADLSGVNLEGANLFETNLTRASFRGAKLAGLRFDSKAALDDLAHPLTEKQIAAAVFIERQIPRNKVTVIREKYRSISAKSQDKMAIVRSISQHKAAVARSIPQKQTAIVRSILFDPENIQAGVGILNYFGEILRQKYEDIYAKVIIEQEGLNVKMAVATVDEEKKIIEKTLEDYIAVVTGRKKSSRFLEDPLAELAFKQKLDLVHLELKQTEVLHSIHKANKGKDIPLSEDSVDRLHDLLLDHICLRG